MCLIIKQTGVFKRTKNDQEEMCREDSAFLILDSSFRQLAHAVMEIL